MEKPITNSMGTRLLWAELLFCSLWLLAVLGGRGNWNTPVHFVAIFTVVLRLSFSFAMARGEKRAWLPLALMVAFGTLTASVHQIMGIDTLAVYPFHILNIRADETAMGIIAVFFVVWIWIVPIVLYLIRLLRKRLVRTDLTWTDLLGGILWKERTSSTYSALMLMCITALYSGLAMDARVCLLVCICAPAFSFWLISRHCGMKRERWWVLVVAMVLFFYSQPLAGLWRIATLAASFALVVYMGSRLYRHTKLHVLTISTILYVGVFLPTLAIGHNPYACIDYGRFGFYTHQPYNGIFYIKYGDCIGLRDRYGLLVKPEYEHIRHHESGVWYDEVALCRDGYVTLYDILGARFVSNDINGELQSDVCRALRNIMLSYDCGYDDRMEVKVTEIPTGKTISHVKATVNGGLIYNYSDEPFLPEDTVSLQSGEIRCDTLVASESSSSKVMLSHALDIRKDSVGIYRIGIKMAAGKMPEQSMAIQLANEIAQSETLSPNDNK